MQLDAECKTTPMADAALQLLKGESVKLDVSFTEASVKREYRQPKFASGLCNNEALYE